MSDGVIKYAEQSFGSILFLGLIVFAMILFAYLVPFLISIRPRRPKESGFPYVFVNNDGTSRELNDEEIVYLSEDFEGGDGARPYVKSNYGSLTPDGRQNGYLRRRQLPKYVLIEPPSSFKT